jgi:hypothetical protein
MARTPKCPACGSFDIRCIAKLFNRGSESEELVPTETFRCRACGNYWDSLEGGDPAGEQPPVAHTLPIG